MGGSKVGACNQCSKKCMLVHGNRDPSSPIVSSFFKIILGDSISNALVIPPSFVKTNMHLLNETTYIEDSSGQHWKVTVCSLGSNLAFQQGWREFASDHSLENGDFLVFNYVAGSHFVVKIYGRSGCEKLDFSKRSSSTARKTTAILFDRLPKNGTKMASTCSPSPANDISSAPATSPSPKSHTGSANKQGSCSTRHLDSDAKITEPDCNDQDAQKVPMSIERMSPAKSKTVLPKDYDEVPFHTMDKDLAVEGACGISSIDLSKFVTLKRKSGDYGIGKARVVTEKKSPYSDAHTVQLQTKCEISHLRKQGNPDDKEPKEKKRASRGAPFDTSDLEMQKISNAEDTCKVLLTKHKPSRVSSTLQQKKTTSKLDFVDGKTANGYESNSSLEKSSLPVQWVRVFSDSPEKDPVFQMKGAILARYRDSITKFAGEMSRSGNNLTTNGKKLKAVKEEYVEKVVRTNGTKPVIVKVEEKFNPGEVKGQPHKVVKTENVELKDQSPFSTVDFCCTVFRDTQSCLDLPADFPSLSCSGKKRMEKSIVLLRDPSMKLWPVVYHERAGFRVLTSGWQALSKANNIRKGDICIFGVDNESEGVFSIRVARK